MTAWKPVPKVTAAALGGAVATLLVWFLDALSGLAVPPEAAAAMTALFAFAFGYLKHPAGTEDDAGYSLVEVMVAAFFAVLIVLVLVRLL